MTKPLKHGAVVAFAEFSPDGRRIVTLSVDGTFRLWDSATGYALAEPVQEVGGCGGIRFNHDGSRLVMGCAATRVWDLPPVDGSCPGWLLSLAEAISGERVNSQNLLERAESNHVSILNSVREQLQGSEPDDWVMWGRWFLANPGTRTISPHSSMTLSEYVQYPIETNTPEVIKDELLHGIERVRTTLERRQLLKSSQGRLAPGINQTTTNRSANPVLTGSRSARGQVIYEDALENGWEDWSWAEVALTNIIPVYAGSRSIKVLPGAMAALYLHHDGYTSTNYNQLSLWVNGGDSSKQLYLQATLKLLAQPGVPLTIPGGVWTQVVEPLSALGVEGQPTFDGFWLQESTGSGQGAFYVDQIELQQSTNISETNSLPSLHEQPGSHSNVPR
jgi:hypothetical protein